MVNCPLCDYAIDAEEDELDEGDTLSCEECGATLTVVSLNPLEVEVENEEDFDDEEDEDFDEDDEEEDDDEDDEENW